MKSVDGMMFSVVSTFFRSSYEAGIYISRTYRVSHASLSISLKHTVDSRVQYNYYIRYNIHAGPMYS
jgi:hypothetical protein